MRTMAKAAASVLLFGAGVGVGYGVAHVVEPGDMGVNDAEHDRLVNACVASPDGEGAACAAFVAGLVDFVEREGCGYSEAAKLLDIEMRYPGVDSEAVNALRDEATADCSG